MFRPNGFLSKMLTYCSDGNPGAGDVNTIVKNAYLPVLNDCVADEDSFNLGIHHLMSCSIVSVFR